MIEKQSNCKRIEAQKQKKWYEKDTFQSQFSSVFLQKSCISHQKTLYLLRKNTAKTMSPLHCKNCQNAVSQSKGFGNLILCVIGVKTINKNEILTGKCCKSDIQTAIENHCEIARFSRKTEQNLPIFECKTSVFVRNIAENKMHIKVFVMSFRGE